MECPTELTIRIPCHVASERAKTPALELSLLSEGRISTLPYPYDLKLTHLSTRLMV
jgi:hypothetical protein